MHRRHAASDPGLALRVKRCDLGTPTYHGARHVPGTEGSERAAARAILRAVRILLVSQMYPGPEDPDLGVFVAQVERALAARGHEIERAVLDRRAGGKRRYLGLARDALTTARRFRPDVVHAHFLVPTGLIAALASRAPLVVPAHGRDVRNVGDGPLRPHLEGRRGIVLTGRVRHDEIPEFLAQAHVLCQPSLIEPFGQALLEAMATGRSVVATRIGGPPEFVPPQAGILVDPADEDALVEALRAAARLPRPNAPARAAAAKHDVNDQARRLEAILERAARGR